MFGTICKTRHIVFLSEQTKGAYTTYEQPNSSVEVKQEPQQQSWGNQQVRVVASVIIWVPDSGTTKILRKIWQEDKIYYLMCFQGKSDRSMPPPQAQRFVAASQPIKQEQ